MTQDARARRLIADLGVVVPTINSARYIDLILSHYAAIGLPVTVFVDEKTTDDTLAIARRLAEKVVEFSNPTWRIGYALENISRRMGTRWVLRFDDDELPSAGLIDFVARVIGDGEGDVAGFPRYQCGVGDGGEVLFHPGHDAVQHRQWRLYQPDKVTFMTDGHTAGFVRGDDLASVEAPADAAMIHLDWVVHTRAERARKVDLYDAHTPGHGSNWRHYYLADELPEFHEFFSDLPMTEFREVGRQLAVRFPEAQIRRHAGPLPQRRCG